MSAVDFTADGPCEPGSDEWHRRLALFLADDAEPQWWWLSFVDTDQPYTEEGDYPGGPRWLGISIVEAPNIVAAGMAAGLLGCNPGGEVSGYPAVPPGWCPKPEFVGRLFAGDEGRSLGKMELDEFADRIERGEVAR